MTGELLFNEGKCAFDFENDVLNIYCLNGEAKSLLWEEIVDHKGVSHLRSTKKDIPFERIEGIIFGPEDKRIVFYIYTKGYGFNGGLPKEKVILHINISKYLIISNYHSQGNYIVFGSKQFHKFLNLLPHYSFNLERNDKLGEVLYHSESKNNKCTLSCYEHQFEVYPHAHYSMGGTKFEFMPQLIFKSLEHLNEETLVKICDKMIIFFQIMFMRTNIIPDKIYYTGCGKKVELFYNKGTAYIEEKEKVDSLQSYGFISWGNVFPHFQTIMDDILSGLVDNKYIGKDSNERRYINFEKVATHSAFFECVYRLIYGDLVKHKTSSQKEVDYLKEKLSSLKEDSKKNLNKKIEFLIGQLDHVSLSSKIQKVFKDYKNCLIKPKELFVLEKYTNEYIANKCAFIRNKIDHGDEEGKIDSHVASCFAYLNCSIYAMLLRRWGLEDDVISLQLNNLYTL